MECYTTICEAVIFASEPPTDLANYIRDGYYFCSLSVGLRPSPNLTKQQNRLVLTMKEDGKKVVELVWGL